MISLQLDLKSGTCLRVSDINFHWGVLFSEYVVLILIRDAAFIFHARFLQTFANPILRNALFTTWFNITYQIWDWYLPCIHSWYSGPWLMLYYPLLWFFCCCGCYCSCSCCFSRMFLCFLTVFWPTKSLLQPCIFSFNLCLGFIVSSVKINYHHFIII